MTPKAGRQRGQWAREEPCIRPAGPSGGPQPARHALLVGWGSVMLCGAMLLAQPPVGASAQGSHTTSDIAVPPPVRLVLEGGLEGLLDSLDARLRRPTISDSEKLDLLRAAALGYLSSTKGDSAGAVASARAAMEAMLEIDPGADFSPGWLYPPVVHSIFSIVRREHARTLEASDPTRIAVAPFYVVDMGGSDRFDWAQFAEALAVIVATDLSYVPGLTVLSREHIDAVESELALATQADLLSEANRLKLREVLSAGGFVYGEVQVLPGDEVVLELRWVQTESGVVLLAEHASKRIRKGSDLLALEREVVVEGFIPKMAKALGVKGADEPLRQAFEHRMRLASGKDAYLKYAAAVAKARRAEMDGRYEDAVRAWGLAHDILPDEPTPLARIRALRFELGMW